MAMGLPSAFSTAAVHAQERVVAAASGGLIGQTMLQELEDLVGDRIEEYDAVGIELRLRRQEHIRRQAELSQEYTRRQTELAQEFDLEQAMRETHREAALGEIHRLSSAVSDDGAFARQLHRRLSKHQRPMPNATFASVARQGKRSSSSATCTLI